MKLTDLEITKKINIARKLQKLGKYKEAEEIYKELLSFNSNSFDLVFSYASFCKDLRNYTLAKQLLVDLTKKFPSAVNPYILIAEILRIENRYAEAEKVLLLARNIDPSNSDLMYNFALLYSTMKKYDPSLFYINKAITLNSNNEIYKVLKGEIFIRKGCLDEALSILNPLKTSDIDFSKIQAKNLISEIWIRKKRYFESEKVLKELIKEYPKLKLGYLNLSDLYIETKQLDKGINLLENVLRIFPDFLPFYKNSALIYKSKGEINLAREFFLKLIQENKFDYDSYYELSLIYDFKDHPEVKDFLLNININQLKSSPKISVAFAISNILHKQKEYKKSSYFLKIANDEASKCAKSSYQVIIQNAEFFRSIAIEKLKSQHNNESNQLVFIVGMPRSGSTLLENVLSLNNQVVDMGEVDFLEESIKNVKNLNKVFNSYNEKIKEKFKGSKIYTDKNLFNYAYCSIIYKYFPNAKIIHCNRNPLDNILSIYRAKFNSQPFSFSLDEISRLYVNHFEIMLEYKEKYGKIIYEYNYEALVKDPSSEIPKIISWLGWEWDDAYLSPHKNKRNVFTASNYQVRQKIYSSSIGIWKEYEELLAPATEIITANQILKDRI